MGTVVKHKIPVQNVIARLGFL